MNFLISLVVSILVGCLYGLLRVHSPAPPLVALVGPMGMATGEQNVWFFLRHH